MTSSVESDIEPKRSEDLAAEIDRAAGYYVSEVDWVGDAIEDAVDPAALMQMFDAHEKIMHGTRT